MSISVNVFTDKYPGETSWTLTNLCTDQTQESVGLDALYTAEATEYSNTYCVPLAEYTFEISDKWSDGLCCNYGDGFYKVTSDETDVAYGTEFGNSESTTFGSCRTPGQPVIATYDSNLGAPKCSTVGVSCTSGDDLLDGMGNFELNPSNSLDECTDGTKGDYHVDESVDKITVTAIGGDLLQAGAKAKIEAKVWAWEEGRYDTADFYYAPDASSPEWKHIRSVMAGGGGSRTLTAEYQLPASASVGVQAVRVNFRFNGQQSPCSGGDYDDTDDLAFSVIAGDAGSIVTQPNLTELPALDLQIINCELLVKERCVAASSSCLWMNGSYNGCYPNEPM